MRAQRRFIMIIGLVLWPLIAFGEPNTSTTSAESPPEDASGKVEDTERPAAPADSKGKTPTPKKKRGETSVKAAATVPEETEAIEAAPLDGEAIEAAPLDGEAIEAAPLDGEAIEAAPLDGEAIEAPTLDGAGSTGQPATVPAQSSPSNVNIDNSKSSAVPIAPPPPPPVQGSRPVDTLDTITIMGTAEELSRVSGSAHLVDEKALEEQEYDDVHRVLKQVPGVYVRDEDGYGLRPNIGLRGANSDRSAKVTLMEDGVLMAPAPYSAPAAYYFPLTTRLTGVEVFKGPASIKYGPNTIGGAVNLITRSAPAKGDVGGIDLSGGLRNSQKVHAYYGHGTEHFGILLEGATLKSDGFKELDNGEPTGFDKAELMLKLRANNSLLARNHHRVELKVGFASENSNETYLGLSDEDFADTPFRRYSASQLGDMDWTRLQGKLNYTALIGEDFEVRLTGYRHTFDRSWRKLNGFSSLARLSISDVLADPTNPRHAIYYGLLRGTHEWTGAENERLAIGTNTRTYVSQGVQMTTQWRWEGGGLGNTLELGLRYHHDTIDRDHTEAEYDMIDGTAVRATNEGLIKQNTGTANAISAHLFDEFRMGRDIRITPGLRVESIHTELQDRLVGGSAKTNDSMVVLPGVGAWVGLGEHWGLIAGVHQGFSPLAPGQSDDAKPETSTNYEVGARWAYRRVMGELIGFMNSYENLVGTCTQSAGCAEDDLDRQFNAGKAQITGLEAVIGTKVPLGSGLVGSGDLTYTWTRARFSSSFASGFAQWGEVEDGDVLPYVPEHQASMKLGVESGSAGISISATFVDDMRDVAGQDDPTEAEMVPGHTVIDAAVFYRPTTQGRIYVTVDNVLGTEYMVSRRPFGARPGKPFHLNLGYGHTF